MKREREIAVSRTAHKQSLVFTGLTLSLGDAQSVLQAEIRPPVRTGDLDRLADGTLVAIIDGILDGDSTLSVSEVRRALKRGMRLLGAASLGALRAHETHYDGMEGSGWVYDAYRTGLITGTDEISVMFDPRSNCPFTLPLVNVRFCLDQFARRGAITANEVEDAMAALKIRPMEERNRRTVLQLARSVEGEQLGAALRNAVRMSSNIKRRDALALLGRLAFAPNLT